MKTKSLIYNQQLTHMKFFHMLVYNMYIKCRMSYGVHTKILDVNVNIKDLGPSVPMQL